MELNPECPLVVLFSMRVNFLHTGLGPENIPEPDRTIVAAADQREASGVNGQSCDCIQVSQHGVLTFT